MTIEHRFEYATGHDPSLNYCLWPYPPPAQAEDKFRSINLLFQSFDHAGIDPKAFAIVEAIRDGIGPFRTVFGIKLLDGRLAWEFYFYDYRRRGRQVSMSRVLGAIRGFVHCGIEPNENLPYFMFSIDLNDDLATGRTPLDVVHMYVGNPGSTVSSGIAYGVRSTGTTLENFYFFFDAASQQTDIAKKLTSSAVFDDTVLPVDAVLVPELLRCRTICVANKSTHDCIYFSGVNVEQLLWFLRRLSYPSPIVDFATKNRANLDHLLFDVGFDYRMEAGRLRILKSGFYGVF
jgi:hypothetical protein